MKYPVGIQDFKTIIQDDFVYVDKTELIYDMVTNGQVYFLSRPRRFGKSLLISTLEYYFRGERELFKGLAIDSLEKEWNSYPVFHIDFNGTNFDDGRALYNLLNATVEGWEKRYGYEGNPLYDAGKRFAELLAYVHETTGKRCVVLIDEYDKPLLDVLDTGYTTTNLNGQTVSIEEFNRGILKGFYSVFKASDAHLRFVLLTGVTKFSQVSVFSGFNQPLDVSMDRRYEALCGITQHELETTLAEGVADFAAERGIAFDEMIGLLKKQYDGYHFSTRLTDIFNPYSVLNSFAKMDLQNFWFASGTPSYLVRLLNHTNENVNELTGKYYDSSEFVDYKADVEKPLPMIYQSGYLTIKDYDEFSNSFLLDFPNNEVKQGFATVLANSYLKPQESTLTFAIRFVRLLSRSDLEGLRKEMIAFFAGIPYSMRRKDSEREKERYFHYTFYLIFRILSSYFVFTEKQQSEGRADCIIEAPHDIYIFEFKLDGTASEALKQINDKGYAKPYAADVRPIHKIGVSFSSQTGTIEEWEVE